MPLGSLAPLQKRSACLVLALWVKPGKQLTGFRGCLHDELVLVINAPRVQGAANRAIIQFVSKALKIRQGDVTIIKGLTSQHKQLALPLSTYPTLVEILSTLPLKNSMKV